MIIPNIWENKIDVPNHQPEIIFHNLTPVYPKLMLHQASLPTGHLSWQRKIPSVKKNTGKSWNLMHDSPESQVRFLEGIFYEFHSSCLVADIP